MADDAANRQDLAKQLADARTELARLRESETRLQQVVEENRRLREYTSLLERQCDSLQVELEGQHDRLRSLLQELPADILSIGSPGRPSATHPEVAQPQVATLRVMLADDHEVVRNGLARLLQTLPDIEVVGQASDGQMAVDMAKQLRPDVVVMDISMPRLDGVEATRRIKMELPHVQIIGLSMHAESDMALRMHQAGASAYLAKSSAPEDLVAAIRACAAGKADAQDDPGAEPTRDD